MVAPYKIVRSAYADEDTPQLIISALPLQRPGQQTTHEQLAQKQIDQNRRRGSDQRGGHLHIPFDSPTAGNVDDGDIDRSEARGA